MSAAGWCDHHSQQISERDSTPIRNDLPVRIRLFGLAIFNGQSEQGRIGQARSGGTVPLACGNDAAKTGKPIGATD